MQHHTRLALTTLTANTILATAITTATAGRFSVSNQQFRVIWSQLELTNSITSNTVRCAVTLEGSVHGRTITKTRGLLVGYLTRANVQNNQCTGGRATVVAETLPWHMTYDSFRGTLPTITGIQFTLIRSGFIIEIPGTNNSKAIGTIESPGRAIAMVGAGGKIESIRADGNAGIPLTNGPGHFSVASPPDSSEATLPLLS